MFICRHATVNLIRIWSKMGLANTRAEDLPSGPEWVGFWAVMGMKLGEEVERGRKAGVILGTHVRFIWVVRRCLQGSGQRCWPCLLLSADISAFPQVRIGCFRKLARHSWV